MSHAVPVAIHRPRLSRRIGNVGRSNSQRAFEAADNAANSTAHNRPDGAGLLISDIRAVRHAVGNALRLRGERTSERYGDAGCEHNMKLHAVTSLLCETPPREARNKAAARQLRGAAARRRRFQGA